MKTEKKHFCLFLFVFCFLFFVFVPFFFGLFFSFCKFTINQRHPPSSKLDEVIAIVKSTSKTLIDCASLKCELCAPAFTAEQALQLVAISGAEIEAILRERAKFDNKADLESVAAETHAKVSVLNNGWQRKKGNNF